LADLIWDNAYCDAKEKNPEFEEQLHSCIAQSFQQYQKSLPSKPNPVSWQMLGLIVMPRALAVCLAPQDQDSYEQILQLRRAIFQNPNLIALGIEQHYHFTAHITLGYFGDVSPNLERDRLGNILIELNQQWQENSSELLVHRTELRKFDDMTRYYREPDWPILDL
jgi:hypothetical protein